MANKDKEKKLNIFQRWGKFFREVYGELKKVTWPTGKELVSYTATVLVFIFLIALMIGVLDFGFGKGFAVLSNVNLGAAVESAATATESPAPDATGDTATPAADDTAAPADDAATTPAADATVTPAATN